MNRDPEMAVPLYPFNMEVIPIMSSFSFQNIEIHYLCHGLEHIEIISENQHLMMAEVRQIVHVLSRIIHLNIIIGKLDDFRIPLPSAQGLLYLQRLSLPKGCKPAHWDPLNP